MHPNFGEWYRLVDLEPDGEKLKKRWAGVSAWASTLGDSCEDVLETVRIFRGLPLKASLDAFRTAFRKQDSAFPQRNDLELRVLAGASLVACVQPGAGKGIVAGAALEATSLCATEDRLDEISREVRMQLETNAVKQRQRRPLDSVSARAKADAAVEAMKQIPSIGNWDILKNVITPIFQDLVDAIREVDGRLSEAAHNLRRADEESNVLWWIEGGCSRDTNEPWAALKHGAAIIAGAELADLTDIGLGPRSAAAILARVLSDLDGKGEELPLATYVNALSDEWVRDRTAKLDDRALDLTPFTRAIVHRGKSNSASWQSFFDASSVIKTSARLTPDRVGRQAYVEAILLRALAHADTEE